MKSAFKASFVPWRFNLLILLILIIVFGLVIRLVELAVFKKHFLQAQGNARALRMVSEPAFRGMITDRNGSPLAISTTVYSVWMDPQEFIAHPPQLKKMAQLLHLKPLAIKQQVLRYKKTKREFVYIKRDISPELAKSIKALAIRGVYLQESFKRYYPEGEIAAHVVGFTNVDDHGQEGLELAFNQWLAGAPGKKMVIKDRLGRIIASEQNLQEKKPGNDLTLSIDRHLQYIAYRALVAGVQANQAESGSAVIIDIKTGEVLAMVNVPSYNPNDLPARNPDFFRNRAVTDVFEPGSTIKTFTIASALDSGQYKPTSIINTFPGWMRVDHHLVHDEHNNGPLTIAQILQLSSNVGATKMVLSLPPNQLWNFLHRVGFGEATGIGFPGERSGELVRPAHWSQIGLATLSYGYGLSVTTLQLAQAYSILATHGIKRPLSLLRIDTPPNGEQVMSREVANDMLQLLESVVMTGGTGKPASVPGYRVAGKTGTAWIAGANGYEEAHHTYMSSFVGIAPASRPRYVVAVVIKDPKGKNYLGGYVSGPVFKDIMKETLQSANVPPDAKA